MSDITCIGELLIDFICKDINSDLIEGENFIKKAGGAPANVAATISKLGGKACLAGKVGEDSFGYFLKGTLDDAGVDTSMLILDKDSKTTLAFVSLRNNGERDFIFNRGADVLYRYEDVNEDKLKASEIIHFGSATALIGGPLRETYYKALKLAREKGIFISFDPNYRVDLWNGKINEFIERSKEFISKADFVKVSDEELKIISKIDDIDKSIGYFHGLGAKIVATTLGKEGTLISTKTDRTIVRSIEIESIDSTGAGDAFTGAVLYKISQLEDRLGLVNNFEKLKEIIFFGNRVGATVCTKMGAIEALDLLEKI